MVHRKWLSRYVHISLSLVSDLLSAHAQGFHIQIHVSRIGPVYLLCDEELQEQSNPDRVATEQMSDFQYP